MRKLPGKSPKNFWGSSGNFWGSLGLSRSSKEPDTLPATRQMSLQQKAPSERAPAGILLDFPGIREVLHGVGADGVGAKFPMFAVNYSRSPLSSMRTREKRRKEKNSEEQQTKAKKSEEKRRKNEKKNKSEEKRRYDKKSGKLLRPHLHQPHKNLPSNVTRISLEFLADVSDSF